MSEKPNIQGSNSALPGGTVTFLFTDIEGSTQLLRRLRDQYTELLAQHHRLLRESFEKWQGRVVDTQGDAFFVAFPRASDAVEAVVEAQKALTARGWPGDETVRVRMGLHTGEPWLVEQGYVGMDVHRAARIAHAGHGGQVLLSEITAALVQDELPDGVSLLDMGKHQLKDMRRPERIQQLVIEGLPSDFPPLNSLADLTSASSGPLDGEVAREPRQVGPSPYRGLAAFRQADAPFFFGREAFTEQLASSVRQQDLVAVIVGPSGSGKSSAVFAGLLPQLQEEDDWLVVSMRPGGKPFHALAAALVPLLNDTLSDAEHLIEIQKLAQAMAAGELPLFLIVERILKQRPEAQHILLVVDQFEELFTQRPDPDEQRQFLDELLQSSAAGPAPSSSPLVVLLTLRADFMGQALAHRPFADALQEGSLMLGPMNRAELQAAVEKPAELQGAAFESGLIPRILDDVGDEPGNLPLLEFALSLLWERIDQGWLTHDAYDEIGRVDGALARYAEEVYEALSPENQQAAQRIFIQLVQPGEGTEDTRRVARRSELGEGNWSLVQHLADKRLVVTGRDASNQETVEVVHEALIRSWQRLRDWNEEDRSFRVWQEGLRAAMRQWQASEQDEGGLLRGAPLVTAESWLVERGSELSPAERDFINTSIVFRTGEVERRERRRRWIMAGLATGLVVALILVVVAFNQRQEAMSNAAEAESERAKTEQEVLARSTAQANAEAERLRAEQEVVARATAQANAESEAQARATAQANAEAETMARATAQAEAEAAEFDALTQASIGLASQVILEVDGDTPERAIPLALEAVENYPYTWQAESALSRAVFANHLRQVLIHDAGMDHGLWSPDGTRILTDDNKNAPLIWDAESGQILLSIPTKREYWGASQWSPTGDRVLTFGEDKSAHVWNSYTGKLELVLSGHEWGDISGVDWSNDEKRILTTGQDHKAKIWDTVTGDELVEFSSHSSAVRVCNFFCTAEESAWSPDGKRIVTADETGGVFIWDPETGEELIRLSGHTDWVRAAVWSPDGQRIATASNDATARIWDANTGEELHRYDADGRILRAHWSPDGKSVLFDLHYENIAVILDTFSGEELLKFTEHENLIWAADWSSDGSRIVTGSSDGSAMVWDSATGEVLQDFRGHSATVGFVQWSPGDDQILTVSQDGTAKIWDLDDQLTVVEIPGDDGGAWLWDWSPDGDRVVRNYFDGSVRIFDAVSGELVATTPPQEEEGMYIIYRAAISPTGDRLLTVHGPGSAIIWDATTGKRLMEVNNATGFRYGNWSPPGSEFATGSNDGSVQIWDVETGQQRLLFDEHQNSVHELAWSPDGGTIASIDDSDAKIWDVNTGQVLFDLYSEDYAFKVESAYWSPEGSRLATHSADGDITIWNAETGDRLQSIAAGGSTIYVINWFPEGERILTGDVNGVIKIWDVASGTEVGNLKIPNSNMAVLSPDGQRVLAAIWPNGPMIIFDVWQSLDELVELARECCVFRELTDLERQQFGLPPVAAGG